MIKVIKKGKPPYRITCRDCDCVFTFEDEDIEKVESRQNEYLYKIACPCCGKVMTSWSKENFSIFNNRMG